MHYEFEKINKEEALRLEGRMRLSNIDKARGMSYKEILSEYSEEICACCFWPEESHHPESLCEGLYCNEALNKWLEDDSERLEGLKC